MANIAQGEAERYISIKAKWWVLYFTYSMWQGNALTGIKFSLIYSRVTIKHTNFANYFRKSGQIRMNSLFSNVCCLIHHCTGWGKQFKSLPVLYGLHIQFYIMSIQFFIFQTVLYFPPCNFMENKAHFCLWSSHARNFIIVLMNSWFYIIHTYVVSLLQSYRYTYLE